MKVINFLMILFVAGIVLLQAYKIANLDYRLNELKETGVEVTVPVPANPTNSGSTELNNVQVSKMETRIKKLESEVALLREEINRVKTTAQNSNVSTAPVSPKNDVSPVTTGKYVECKVTAKAKLENRYPIFAYEPEVDMAPIGVVVINIEVQEYGRVLNVNVGDGTTISDEDIIDACKEAALQTSFSINDDIRTRQRGTITYKFTAK